MYVDDNTPGYYNCPNKALKTLRVVQTLLAGKTLAFSSKINSCLVLVKYSESEGLFKTCSPENKSQNWYNSRLLLNDIANQEWQPWQEPPHDWTWALEQLKQNRVVYRRAWISGAVKQGFGGSIIFVDSGSVWSGRIDDFVAQDWTAKDD